MNARTSTDSLLYIDASGRGANRVRDALAGALERVASQGVSYHDDAGRSTAGRSPRLVIDARVGLANLDPASRSRAVSELDPRTVHAVVVIRGLARTLSLDWQELVIEGMSQSLEDWLSSSTASSSSVSPPGSWLGSRQREVAAGWIDRLGPDRVTVVVACDDHFDVLRAIEALAGLEAGTLQAQTRLRALTFAETEAIRALNRELDEQGGRRRVRRSRLGASARGRMADRSPGDDEAAVALPTWTEELIHHEVMALTSTLSAAGVQLIGSLSCLSEGATSPEAGPVTGLPSEAAARLTLGIVDAVGLGRHGGPKPAVEPRELAGVPAFRLVVAIATRPARTIRGTFGMRRRAPAKTEGRAVGRDPTARDDRGSNESPDHGRIGARPTTLPPGARLLHIGPSKTGTTALQAALDRARLPALEQNVRVVGWRRHARAAVLEASGRPSGHPGRASREWRDIVRELRTATEARAVFSSEELSHGDAAFISRLVDEIGALDVHVAVTLRPLARILPSVWQEGVKAGIETPFEPWLRKVLRGPGEAPAFWQRHRHDALIRRWAATVGADRVTVIVVDDRDQSSLPRAFESLLGLRPGTLGLHRDLANRSLTRGEIEAVRALNSMLEQDGHQRDFRRVVVGLGVSYRMRLRDPDPREARIRLPPWAEEAVSAIAREMVEGIAVSGVRVIGDLATLTAAGSSHPSDSNTQARVPPTAAAAMAIGVLEAAGLVAPSESDGSRSDQQDAGHWIAAKLAITPTGELWRALLRRAQRSASTVVRGAAGR